MLLRHCCWCGRGLILSVVGTSRFNDNQFGVIEFQYRNRDCTDLLVAIGAFLLGRTTVNTTVNSLSSVKKQFYALRTYPVCSCECSGLIAEKLLFNLLRRSNYINFLKDYHADRVRPSVRLSVCPVFFNLNRARGAYSTWLTRDSTRRGQRTFPSEYYEDGHTC